MTNRPEPEQTDRGGIRAGPLGRAFARAVATMGDGADWSAPVAGDSSTLALFDMARRAAPSDATILVTGPSGAGKG
jgi:DNA-binding NtrC family response regulator